MTRRPLRTDDKSEVLRKLEESSMFHFEKTCTACQVKRNSRLAIPSWFIQEHGGKLLEYVVLSSQPYLASWTVRLCIELRGENSAIVTFGPGWLDFVSFFNLVEGDSVVFSLTSMSEFEVYVFREESSRMSSPMQCPSLVPRQRSCGSDLVRKKAKRPRGRKGEQFVAEGNTEGVAKPITSIAEKTAECSHAIPAYTSIHSSAPLHSLEAYLQQSENKNNRDCSSGVQSDISIGRKSTSDPENFNKTSGFDTKDGPAEHSDVRTKKEKAHEGSILHEKDRIPPLLPSFMKKVGVSSISLPGLSRAGAFLEIPIGFWKKYRHRLRPVVKLQGIREDSMVRSMRCGSAEKIPYTRIRLRNGWDSFAAENNLKLGDELIFTLTGESFFEVRKALWAPLT